MPSDIEQAQAWGEDNSLKDRVLRLFKFLYEVNRLRYRPERTLQEQVLVISAGGAAR